MTQKVTLPNLNVTKVTPAKEPWAKRIKRENQELKERQKLLFGIIGVLTFIAIL
tara:strand:+ start:1035 stop:1196 length:162 start_codon:yes stop_codon:yes gene_type:complete